MRIFIGLLCLGMLALAPQTAKTQELLRFGGGCATGILAIGPSRQIELKIEDPLLDEVQVLASAVPRRIDIRFSGCALESGRLVTFSADTLLDKVETYSTPRESNITLLLKTEQPRYSWSLGGHGFRLEIERPPSCDDGGADPPLASWPDSPPAAITPLAVDRLPMQTPASAASAAAATLEAAQAPQLKDIEFAYEDSAGSPIIKLIFTKASKFTAARAAARIYLLHIPQGTLAAAHLSLPRYPPPDFAGFALVQAAESGDGLTIRIGVEPGARLNAFARGCEIWLKHVSKGASP